MAKRYSKKQAKELIEVIRDRRREGKRVHEIAEVLNSAGHLMASGNPWTRTGLNMFISKRLRMIGRKNTKRREAPRPTAMAGRAQPKKSIYTVENIITDPSLNDRQRVKMISAFLEL